MAIAAGPVKPRVGDMRPLTGLLTKEIGATLGRVPTQDVSLRPCASRRHETSRPDVPQEAERGPAVVLPEPAGSLVPSTRPILVSALTHLTRNRRKPGRTAARFDAPAVGSVKRQAVPTAVDGLLLPGVRAIRSGRRLPQVVSASFHTPASIGALVVTRRHP